MNAKERHEEARFLGQKTTPKSEQRRIAWGSLIMRPIDTRGLCTAGVKCVKRDAHLGECWPKEH